MLLLEEELLESCRRFRFIVYTYTKTDSYLSLSPLNFLRACGPSPLPLILPKLSSKFVTVFILHYRNFKSLIKQPAITLLLVPGIKMQCSNSNSNSSGGGLIDRKPSYFGHPAGSVTLSSLSSLSSLNLSNIGGLSSGLSISNIPGTVSSNVHHTTTAPPTTMYYDPIKYSMSNV